jgi:hypothetical protein
MTVRGSDDRAKGDGSANPTIAVKFSFSSVRNRAASDTVMPPYVASQL